MLELAPGLQLVLRPEMVPLLEQEPQELALVPGLELKMHSQVGVVQPTPRYCLSWLIIFSFPLNSPYKILAS